MKSIFGMAFTGAAEAIPSQQVFTVDTAWVVPAGVYAISALCMQRGTTSGETWTGVPAARIVRSGTDLVRAKNGDRLGDGGGDGGYSGYSNTYVENSYDGDTGWGLTRYAGGGGGGGAGGYAGDGGYGGDYTESGNYASWGGKAAAANSGGGGGGTCGEIATAASGGGGVGLLGIGATGGVAYPSNPWPVGGRLGSGGSNGAGGRNQVYFTDSYGVPRYVGAGNEGGGGTYGGAQGDVATTTYGTPRGRGGANSWKNSIAVTPGETLQIYVQGNGAVRVLWGGGRSYPSNAGNL